MARRIQRATVRSLGSAAEGSDQYRLIRLAVATDSACHHERLGAL